MSDLVKKLRAVAEARSKSWSAVAPIEPKETLVGQAADEIERLRTALEVASDEILSMYRTWVADDYEAMPTKNSLPGKAYYSARAALKETTP
ncbi:hypothetical protein HAAEEKHM_00057 [Sinorhizobium phage AP-16-3]|nr:hypothetical protein HAAEEKHM_00057 [Sinorhizobium phage AP-16-3]